MNDRKRTGRFMAEGNQRMGDATKAMLPAAVDWFVHPRIRGGDTGPLHRARLVVVFDWGLISVAIVYAAIFFWIDSPIGIAALIAGVGMGVASLFVMRRAGSCLAAGNLHVAGLFGILTAMSYRLGGCGSAALPWYAAAPIVALCAAGRRSAISWLAVTAACLAAFYALDYSGYPFPNDLVPQHDQLPGVLSWVGLIVLMLGLALLYEMAESQALVELRSAEASLMQERRFSDSAIASLPGIFYLSDNEGRFLRWNENYERVSGYSPEELSRMHPLDFFRGKDREVIEQRIGDVFTMGQAAAEADLATKDGRAIPHLFSGKRILIDGTPHLVGMGVDITERRQAEEKLRQKMEQLERLNRLMTGREKRVMEMKSQINELLAELGRKRRYRTTA
jgi:PAS domain S-box-containing protein